MFNHVRQWGLKVLTLSLAIATAMVALNQPQLTQADNVSFYGDQVQLGHSHQALIAVTQALTEETSTEEVDASETLTTTEVLTPSETATDEVATEGEGEAASEEGTDTTTEDADADEEGAEGEADSEEVVAEDEADTTTEEATEGEGEAASEEVAADEEADATTEEAATDELAMEIVEVTSSFDPIAQQLFMTDGSTVEIVDLTDPENPVTLGTLTLDLDQLILTEADDTAEEPSSEPFQLQILHASDLEGGVDAISNAPNFGAVVEALEADAQASDIPSILLSAGDNVIPGPFYSASADGSMRELLQASYQTMYDDADLTNIREGAGRIDYTMMNILGFDASAVGNHDFDAGTGAFADLMNTDIRGGTLEDIRWLGTNFPYLSANLDFSNDGELSGLYTSTILANTAFGVSDPLTATSGSPSIAPATMIERNGEMIGVVGATTQIVEQISSTGDVIDLTGGSNDMAALAEVLQPQIDALTEMGINKVILVTHLQQIALEKELAGLLTDVDVIIAGGSDTLQADENDSLIVGDTADEAYPYQATDAADNPTLIVSTAGEYSYVGRLVVEFDSAGVLVVDSLDSLVNGAYATDEASVVALTGAADLAEAIASSPKASEIQNLTDAVSTIVTEKDGQVYGFTDVYLEGQRSAVRTEETNLGNLTADSMLASAQLSDTTVLVALKNGGGIRAEIGAIDFATGELLPSSANPAADKSAGGVSQLDIENSLRFDNELTLLTLTAQDLVNILEHSVANSGPGQTPGQFPQVAGVQFSYDTTGTAIVFDSPDTGAVLTAGTRVQDVRIVDSDGELVDEILVEGEAQGDMERTIRVVTLNFLAGGGDGYPYPAFATDVVETGIGEQTALADYLQANHATAETAYSQAETPISEDTRIILLNFPADEEEASEEVAEDDAMDGATEEGDAETSEAEGDATEDTEATEEVTDESSSESEATEETTEDTASDAEDADEAESTDETEATEETTN